MAEPSDRPSSGGFSSGGPSSGGPSSGGLGSGGPSQPGGQSDTVKRLMGMLNIPMKISFVTPPAPSALPPSGPAGQALQLRPILPAPSAANATPPQATKSRKRKARVAGEGAQKKKKVAPVKKDKPVPKPVPALPSHLWVMIAEFCTPKEVQKLHLLNKGITAALKKWENQVAISQIVQTYGSDMPTSFSNLSPVQYNLLLSGRKGCRVHDCDDKKASKVYWPFGRTWCFDCWTAKTIKESHVFDMMNSKIVSNDKYSACLLTLCIPYALCDSFGKTHKTFVGPIPRNQAPKLERVYNRDDVENILKLWMEFVPPVYVQDPQKSAQQNSADADTHAQLRMQKRNERVDHFKALWVQNDKHMANVCAIENCIKEANKSAKDLRASVRERKKEIFAAKAKAEIPDIPFADIRTLKCYKDAVRNSNAPRRDVNFDRSWELLRKKIQDEMCKEHPERSSEISSAFSSRTSTPVPSQPSNLSSTMQGQFSTAEGLAEASTAVVFAQSNATATPSQAVQSSQQPQAQQAAPAAPAAQPAPAVPAASVAPVVPAIPAVPTDPIQPDPVKLSSQLLHTATHPESFDNANPHVFTSNLHNPDSNHLDFKCNCSADTDNHTHLCSNLRRAFF